MQGFADHCWNRLSGRSRPIPCKNGMRWPCMAGCTGMWLRKCVRSIAEAGWNACSHAPMAILLKRAEQLLGYCLSTLHQSPRSSSSNLATHNLARRCPSIFYTAHASTCRNCLAEAENLRKTVLMCILQSFALVPTPIYLGFHCAGRAGRGGRGGAAAAGGAAVLRDRRDQAQAPGCGAAPVSKSK